MTLVALTAYDLNGASLGCWQYNAESPAERSVAVCEFVGMLRRGREIRLVRAENVNAYALRFGHTPHTSAPDSAKYFVAYEVRDEAGGSVHRATYKLHDPQERKTAHERMHDAVSKGYEIRARTVAPGAPSKRPGR